MKKFLIMFVILFSFATTVNSKEVTDNTIMCETYSDLMAILESANAGDAKDFRAVLEYYFFKKVTCMNFMSKTKVAIVKKHGAICEVVIKNVSYDETMFVACAFLKEEK